MKHKFIFKRSFDSMITSKQYLEETRGRVLYLSEEEKATVFDESHLLYLNRNNIEREHYVKEKLFGNLTTEPRHLVISPKTKLSSSKYVRIKTLKEQIERVKQKRIRLIQKGEQKVKDLMNRLQREQEEFEMRSKNWLEEEEEMMEAFAQEIEELKAKLERSREPFVHIKDEMLSKNGSSSCSSE